MAEAVYLMCALTSLVGAALLLKGYWKSRTRLLLWASLCFVGLALHNVLLFVDLVVISSVDLSLLRAVLGLAALCVLLFGLVWDVR